MPAHAIDEFDRGHWLPAAPESFASTEARQVQVEHGRLAIQFGDAAKCRSNRDTIDA